MTRPRSALLWLFLACAGFLRGQSVGNVTMLLKPRAGLEEFLAAQQDPQSAEYRKWLTPEEFADRFGRPAAEIDGLTAWLRSQGFAVKGVGRGRNWIEFGGTAGQLRRGLGVSARQPAVPPEFLEMVAGFTGLSPARMRARRAFNSASGTHYLAPDDLASIYGLTSLGLDGTGLTIAVVGQSAIDLTDIAAFRKMFHLPAADPRVIVTGTDPGVNSGDRLEAHLDIEWAGALAPRAAIVYVYAQDVRDAAKYVIDQNLAPVLSMSFYGCEPDDSPAGNLLAQQANAQGITWLAASGDAGAASCDGVASATARTASLGPSVSFPASYPEVTGVGGTTFAEGAGSYWGAVNGANGGSAVGYIPEVAWNDTAPGALLLASGGGASVHYRKPLWQNAPGVPADGARDVPDVSLASSPGHDGYLLYSNGQLSSVGGTSAATPVFAGIVALWNQSLMNRGLLARAGLGNINPALYRLYNSGPDAFHDVTSGNNLVPCVAGTPGCGSGGTFGYFAGLGYDQVTGLGSVDAGKLILRAGVPSGNPTASAVALSVSPNPAFQQTGGLQWLVTLTLQESAGAATAITGVGIGGTNYAVSTFFPVAAIGPYGSVSASLTISFPTAPALPASETFSVSGKDANGRTWTQQATVQLLGPLAANAPAIAAVVNGASFKPVVAPGMAVSVFGVNLANGAQQAGSVPLPKTMQGVSATVNGAAALLYYVSPGQLNLQVPYTTPTGSATLVTTLNGRTASFPLTVQAAAPGIFSASGALVPVASVTAGTTLEMFITGEGMKTAEVRVGGVLAAIKYQGIPPALVGTPQVNFTVPAGVGAGMQPVVVRVAGVDSPPVFLNVVK